MLPRIFGAKLAVCAIPAHAACAVGAVHEFLNDLAGAGLAVGLSTALWNYIGWDNASTVQGEVVDASRSYPRALLVALPLVTLAYFVPLLPTLAATDGTKWQDGSWPSIAAAATGRGRGRSSPRGSHSADLSVRLRCSMPCSCRTHESRS